MKTFLWDHGLQHWKNESSTADAAGFLAEKKRQEPSSARKECLASTNNSRTRSYLALFGIILVVILVRLAQLQKHPTTGTGRPFPPLDRAPLAIDLEQIPVEDHYFHIVIPSVGPSLGSTELCKTIISAGVLNYPSAWSVSWNATLDKTGKVFNETLAKIDNVSRWLAQLPEDRDDDIIAILGNSKSWFQVRPDVLLKRYFAILDERNKHMAQEFATKTIKALNMSDKIVFATAEDCPSGQSKACVAVPSRATALQYLNTDFTIGPAKDVKRLLQKATALALNLTETNAVFNEYDVFASLLADQEKHRNSLRKMRHLGDNSFVEEANRTDFGITFDFAHQLSYTVQSNLEDARWVKYSEYQDIRLPKDIARSMPPFWTLDGKGDGRSWRDVQLLTHSSSYTVPAVVQRGPAADKSLTHTWWQKMWFQPHTRKLFDTFALIPIIPVAIFAGKGGSEQRYWSPHWEKAGIHSAQDLTIFHKWKDICHTEQIAQSLFLDGRGLWEDSRP